MLAVSGRRGRSILASHLLPPFVHSQILTYVNVRTKWKKDTFYDTLEVVNESKELKTIITLKNVIVRSSERCIPISDVSKMSRIFEIHGRVAAFFRKYPSFFKEFTGPHHDLPWFALTPEAEALDLEERAIFEDRSVELFDRLRRLIMMTKEKRLPLQIIHGMQWYLGLPEDFTKRLRETEDIAGWFRLVEVENGVKELGIDDDGIEYPPPLSVVQKNVLRLLKSGGGSVADISSPHNISFPVYPSKGVRLKRKIADWLEEFQKLPYLSPYDHDHHREWNTNSDLSDKRVVGVLHELLSLMVDHSAERRRLLCLRKHLCLPQKFGRAFERHPLIFYLHMKNKTCNVVLKEGYHGGQTSAIELHPMLPVREKYVQLMRESDVILRRKRSGKVYSVSVRPRFRSKEEESGCKPKES
ncbi:Ubiquitin carboxyl-terminal hydrolase family protein [Zostera marina]|uniref:Ubiquitin carboxyl-terminal hydrolase family protein n=1 Tax=Zostera marina TaxID=29655 RepID=A0A0K9PND9_ZOSMR|nr:Ubiquitin carboxyl-terminal hydrolase family protein [Zostera marina]